MAAKTSTLFRTPGLADDVAVRLRDMEALADAGEWAKIESQLKRLPALIARVPLSERREVVQSVRTVLDRIRDRAAGKRHEVTQRLATIKTGRQATESYRATGAMAPWPEV